MELYDAIKKRRSIRSYLDKKPDWRTILSAIDYARFAPMAGNIFSVKFILVSNEKVIQKLKKACQQDFVSAPYIVVVVSDSEKVTKMYDSRKKGFSSQQAGAAIQNVLLAMTEKKLAHCWVGLFDDAEVRDILEIPKNMTIEALIPVGLETKSKSAPPIRRKPELENIIYFDKFGESRMTPESRVSADWA